MSYAYILRLLKVLLLRYDKPPQAATANCACGRIYTTVILFILVSMARSASTMPGRVIIGCGSSTVSIAGQAHRQQ